MSTIYSSYLFEFCVLHLLHPLHYIMSVLWNKRLTSHSQSTRNSNFFSHPSTTKKDIPVKELHKAFLETFYFLFFNFFFMYIYLIYWFCPKGIPTYRVNVVRMSCCFLTKKKKKKKKKKSIG